MRKYQTFTFTVVVAAPAEATPTEIADYFETAIKESASRGPEPVCDFLSKSVYVKDVKTSTAWTFDRHANDSLEDAPRATLDPENVEFALKASSCQVLLEHAPGAGRHDFVLSLWDLDAGRVSVPVSAPEVAAIGAGLSLAAEER